MQLAMSSGESPVLLTSQGLQVAVTSALVSATGNSVYRTPPSNAQVTYGAIAPKVTLGPNGLKSCPRIETYVQLSILQWSSNPYASSQEVVSPLLRIASARQSKDVSTVIGAFRSFARRTQQTSISYPEKGVPAYTLSIEFSSRQNFNFSAAGKLYKDGRTASNYSIPACTIYDGVNYVPCNECNISSYTNLNVIYSCYDITPLCPTSSRRFSVTEGQEVEDGEGEEEGEEMNRDVLQTFHDYSRSLQTLNDDGSQAATRAAVYGVLLQTIQAQLSSVLSSNPFLLRPSESKTILAFMGTLCSTIILILLLLRRMDREEILQKKYVQTESDIKAKMFLEEDIRNGKREDPVALYAYHVSKFKHQSQQSISVFRTLRRTTSSLLSMVGRRGNPKHDASGTIKCRSSDSNDGFSNNDSNRNLDIDTDSGSDRDTYSHEFSVRPSISRSEIEHRATSSVTEFLHRLFPGHAVITKRSSFIRIVADNHNYFKMFGASTLTQPRSIRFLDLVALVLVSLFVDTLFFGIFFPGGPFCSMKTNEVRDMLSCLIVLFWIFALMYQNACCLSISPPSSSSPFYTLHNILCLPSLYTYTYRANAQKLRLRLSPVCRCVTGTDPSAHCGHLRPHPYSQ